MKEISCCEEEEDNNLISSGFKNQSYLPEGRSLSIPENKILIHFPIFIA